MQSIIQTERKSNKCPAAAHASVDGAAEGEPHHPDNEPGDHTTEPHHEDPNEKEECSHDADSHPSFDGAPHDEPDDELEPWAVYRGVQATLQADDLLVASGITSWILRQVKGARDLLEARKDDCQTPRRTLEAWTIQQIVTEGVSHPGSRQLRTCNSYAGSMDRGLRAALFLLVPAATPAVATPAPFAGTSQLACSRCARVLLKRTFGTSLLPWTPGPQSRGSFRVVPLWCVSPTGRSPREVTQRQFVPSGRAPLHLILIFSFARLFSSFQKCVWHFHLASVSFNSRLWALFS